MDYCKTCVYYPPSSCDGKPCTQCDPESVLLNCYQKKEEEEPKMQNTVALFASNKHAVKFKTTNADRIRSMTDEELAEMLNHAQGDGYLVGIGQRKMSAYGNWLEWLQQESDGE